LIVYAVRQHRLKSLRFGLYLDREIGVCDNLACASSVRLAKLSRQMNFRNFNRDSLSKERGEVFSCMQIV
jgi:hypothetical protein